MDLRRRWQRWRRTSGLLLLRLRVEFSSDGDSSSTL
jgi:hypothetical protein